MYGEIDTDHRTAFEPPRQHDVVGRVNVDMLLGVGLVPLLHLGADDGGHFGKFADDHAHCVHRVAEHDR